MTRLLLLLGLAGSLTAQSFLAGVAKVELDPPLGMAMSGYASRRGVSQSVLDPLESRVLALSDGRRTIALATLDVIFPFEPPEMEEIRAAAANKGVDEVIFHASHTHSGPAYSTNREAYRKAVERVGQAISQAASRLEPVRIGAGWGVVYIGHNRIYLQPDGQPRMLWRNPTMIPTAPVDPTVGVIRLDGAGGAPLAILVNYACHPVVFGSDSLDYSADFPGEMRRVLEQALGGMAIFLQGAPGDINPFKATTPRWQDTVTLMKQAGRDLGQEAVRVARRIQTQPVSNPVIRSKTVIVKTVARWDVAKLRRLLEVRYSLDKNRAGRLLRETMDLPLTTLLLNDDMAFVTMPGEPFVAFQMQLRARSPLENTFFLGYTNGTFGYFPTIAAAVRGGYGANSTATQVEVGAGERMLNTGLVSLYELLGKLKPAPAQGEW